MTKGTYKQTEEHKRKISESLKGDKNPNYGKKFTQEHRTKMSEARGGKNNIEISRYNRAHYWINARMGKPNKCEHCSTTTAKRFEWSNKSQEYIYKLNDWQRLCVKCHHKYDMDYKKESTT